MKPTALLVNTSRAGADRSRRFGGSAESWAAWHGGFDVYENEPLLAFGPLVGGALTGA